MHVCVHAFNARSQSRLAMTTTINSVKFNTSKTQLLTISLFNNPVSTLILVEDIEILPINCNNIFGLQISSSLSWRDHIVQIAESASKTIWVLFRCKQYFNSTQIKHWLYSPLLGILLSYLGYFPFYCSSC